MSTADVHDGLAAGLRKLGHEVYEYALDQRIERSGAWLTYCWRRGGKALAQPTAADILYHAGEELVARALRVMPDVVLVVSAMFLHPDVLVLLGRARLNVAILFTESPYDEEQQRKILQARDQETGRGLVAAAWTNERTCAVDGIKYLPHAWNPDVHLAETQVPVEAATHQVVFVATGFSERIEVLSAVDWTGIDLALYGQWDLLGSRNKLRQYIKGEYVSNAVAAQLYRNASIGLNLYRTSRGFGRQAPRIVGAESLNPRAYELAATGCFTISDYRAEIGEVFGDLVPTFRTPRELRPLLDDWLADDVGRARVRAALPKAVAGATWLARARQIEADLQGAGIVARQARNDSAGAADAAPAFAGGS